MMMKRNASSFEDDPYSLENKYQQQEGTLQKTGSFEEDYITSAINQTMDSNSDSFH